MSDHDDDFNFEPMPGLPALPPSGEEVLWQGRPDSLRLAREAYGLTWVAGYFGLIVGWQAMRGFAEAGMAGALAFGIPYLLLGLVGCGIVFLLAHAQARTTVYTITSARVVLRIGAALSVSINLPFRQIESAGLDLKGNGSGTIALALSEGAKLSWLTLWPHVRPWRLARPEPALRCIPDAARVARLLAEAAETRLAEPVILRADPPAAALAAE
ncbi:MAG: photosynthetic complex putative assembly protein PuhB [Pseudorhodobacter sp.]